MEEIIIHINGRTMANVDVSVRNVMYHVCHVREKDYVWNPATCNCENGSIMDDSAIIEFIESYEEETNKQSVKSKISMFYLHF